jgi:hypothetical protein
MPRAQYLQKVGNADTERDSALDLVGQLLLDSESVYPNVEAIMSSMKDKLPDLLYRFEMMPTENGSTLKLYSSPAYSKGETMVFDGDISKAEAGYILSGYLSGDISTNEQEGIIATLNLLFKEFKN